MLKRYYFNLLLIGMIAAAPLGMAKGVNAACTSSELQSSSCFSAGGYDVRIVPGPDGEFPVNNNPSYCNGGANCYTYSFTKNTSKNVAQVDVLIPVCSSTSAITVQTGYPSGWHVSAPGAGGQNTGYAFGVYQDYVLEYSFNTENGVWFSTNKSIAKPTSMAMKIGSGLYAGSILGPSCYQAKIATTTSQKIQLNPNNPEAYITVTSNTDGSVASITDSSGNPLEWYDLNEFSYIDGQPVTYMPDGAIMKTGQNSCYTYFYNGRYCRVCY